MISAVAMLVDRNRMGIPPDDCYKKYAEAKRFKRRSQDNAEISVTRKRVAIVFVPDLARQRRGCASKGFLPDYRVFV